MFYLCSLMQESDLLFLTTNFPASFFFKFHEPLKIETIRCRVAILDRYSSSLTKTPITDVM